MKEIEEVVSVGSHVIVQRLDFKKMYRVSENGSLALGKEEIKMSEIIGKPFWTTFKIIGPQEKRDKRSKGRQPPSTLVVAEKCESLVDLKSSLASGYDNRSIKDDGKSQKLSKDDILGFKDAGKSGREIVSSLIENNVSFTEKTEYSQEKYIKKKEQKYCQFLTIHKPTLSALHEIYTRQDSSKIYGLRKDTLAQIFCYGDVKSNGTFVLYDSGTAGLVPAGMLSRIGACTPGNLLYLHSGDHLPQMPILRAMNFPQEQLGRLTVVSIFDFLKTYYKNKIAGESIIQQEVNVQISNAVKDDHEISSENHQDKMDVTENISATEDQKVVIEIENSINNKNDQCEKNKCEKEDVNDLKRKNDSSVQEGPVMKKSRKVLDIEQGVELLTGKKADALIVIAKEHPLEIMKELLFFVKASRPFVIYHSNREPLQETYLALKQQGNVVNLRIYSNFLREYQVLPDRTHPEILTNDSGGYLLTGYTVC